MLALAANSVQVGDPSVRQFADAAQPFPNAGMQQVMRSSPYQAS